MLPWAIAGGIFGLMLIACGVKKCLNKKNAPAVQEENPMDEGLTN
jgi:hypothetical protein